MKANNATVKANNGMFSTHRRHINSQCLQARLLHKQRFLRFTVSLYLTLIVSLWGQEDSHQFQTRYDLSGWCKSYCMTPNNTSNETFSIKYHIQRRIQQWRITVEAGTNSFIHAGCDGTNIYAILEDRPFYITHPNANAPGYVYPGIIPTFHLSLNWVWFAFMRDTVPSSARQHIPYPNHIGNQYGYAHVYILTNTFEHNSAVLLENGAFIVDARRLKTAHLSPFLLASNNPVNIPYVIGATGMSYSATFKRQNDGYYHPHDFQYVINDNVFPEEYLGRPRAVEYYIYHIDVNAYTNNSDTAFSCYPDINRQMDIYDYRLWNREKGFLPQIYKSKAWLHTNNIANADYRFDISKALDERTKGRKVAPSYLPLTIVILVAAFGPLAYQLATSQRKQQSNNKKQKGI